MYVSSTRGRFPGAEEEPWKGVGEEGPLLSPLYIQEYIYLGKSHCVASFVVYFAFSLLEEDSEEEGDLCRICQIPGGSPTNPLLEPCACVGSLQFVHQECLKRWLKVKITSGK